MNDHRKDEDKGKDKGKDERVDWIIFCDLEKRSNRRSRSDILKESSLKSQSEVNSNSLT